MNLLVAAFHDESDYWLAEIPAGWRSMALHKERDLPNTGREAATFLFAMEYIAANSDPLEAVAFVQGDPFDHAPELFDDLADPVTSFRWLGYERGVSKPDGSPHHPGLPLAQRCSEWLGLPCPQEFEFAPGGQFVVPATFVRMRRPEFYADLRAQLDDDTGPWCWERMWPLLFAGLFAD